MKSRNSNLSQARVPEDDSNLAMMADSLSWPWKLQSLEQLQSPDLVELELIRPEGILKAYLSFFKQNCKQMESPELSLSSHEFRKYSEYSFEKRQREFLMGRLAAKESVRRFKPNLRLPDIEICSDIFNRPYVQVPGCSDFHLSLTHSRDLAMAIVAPQKHPLGIDVEYNEPNHAEVVGNEMTDAELELFQALQLDGTLSYTLNWTIKEAYSKALGIGLTTPFKILEVERIESKGQGHFESWLKNFNQFRVFSWIQNRCLFSIAVPYKTQFRWHLAPRAGS